MEDAELAQWLKALATFPEDPGWVPSTIWSGLQPSVIPVPASHPGTPASHPGTLTINV